MPRYYLRRARAESLLLSFISRLYSSLFSEAADAVGYGQADNDHVDDEAQKDVVKGVRACGLKGGERQNDVTHYQFDGHPIEQAADQSVLGQKSELAAGDVVNGSDRRSDEEVQQDAENVRTGASMKCLLAEQACRNYERNAAAEEDEGLNQVERSGDEAAYSDGEEGAAGGVCGGDSDGRFGHGSSVHFGLDARRNETAGTICNAFRRSPQVQECAATYGADDPLSADPALARWANLWRALGACGEIGGISRFPRYGKNPARG